RHAGSASAYAAAGKESPNRAKRYIGEPVTIESPRQRYATTAENHAPELEAERTAAAIGTAMPATKSPRLGSTRLRSVSTRYASTARPASKADCLTMSAEPVSKPASTSQWRPRPRMYCVKASSESTAGSAERSSPDSVKDSR